MFSEVTIGEHCRLVALLENAVKSEVCVVLYCNQTPSVECCCVAGLVWNRLTDVEKAPYLRGAEEEKHKYEARMRDYTSGVSR